VSRVTIEGFGFLIGYGFTVFIIIIIIIIINGSAAHFVGP
jgi:hypothetical protein